jgi:hypothetical protein
MQKQKQQLQGGMQQQQQQLACSTGEERSESKCT